MRWKSTAIKNKHSVGFVLVPMEPPMTQYSHPPLCKSLSRLPSFAALNAKTIPGSIPSTFISHCPRRLKKAVIYCYGRVRRPAQMGWWSQTNPSRHIPDQCRQSTMLCCYSLSLHLSISEADLDLRWKRVGAGGEKCSGTAPYVNSPHNHPLPFFARLSASPRSMD